MPLPIFKLDLMTVPHRRPKLLLYHLQQVLVPRYLWLSHTEYSQCPTCVII